MEKVTRYFLFFLLFFMVCRPLSAESYIYFQNNTSDLLQITTTQSGNYTLPDAAWWGKDGSIAPWQEQSNILWTNRNKHIKSGENYRFTVTLSTKIDTLQFLVNLKGRIVGSSMKFALTTPELPVKWYNDKEFHEATFMFGGKLVTAKFAAYNTRTAHSDILLVLHEVNPYPNSPIDLINPDVLNVLSYNIYMLPPPLAFTNQELRAQFIPDYVHGYDAIIFSEAFYNSARETLLEGLSPEYPYHTNILNKNYGFVKNGGVIIVSRWPIEFSDQMIYTNCGGEDCYAAKGVMYARINKLGRPYNLFGTHTQAWKSDEKVALRQAQLAELHQFIMAQNIPSNEAILIGGDLNVDKIENKLDEYCQMLNKLNVKEPAFCPYPFTCNGQDNYYYADDNTAEYLDYIFPLFNKVMPLKATNQVRILRAIEDQLWNIFDLSDHFSVCGRFVFPSVTVTQNGHTSNSDVLVNNAPVSADTNNILNRFAQYMNNLCSRGDTLMASISKNLDDYLNTYTGSLLTDAGTIADTAAIKQQLRVLQKQGNVLLMMQPALLPIAPKGR